MLFSDFNLLAVRFKMSLSPLLLIQFSPTDTKQKFFILLSGFIITVAYFMLC